MIKKLILLGFGLTLLIGLPLAVFVLQNQTQPQSGAAPVTKFSFDGPTQVEVGDAFDEVINVDPGGSNQVSFIKFTFTYDPSKLDKATDPVSIDEAKYTKLEGPSVTCTDSTCTVTATISVGANKDAIIKSKTGIATMHFIAKANTDAGVPTQLVFSGSNQALSVGGSDQAAENVYQTGIPTSITIGDQGNTPTTGPEPTGTDGTGGTGDNGGNPGGSGSTGGSENLSVSCTSFTPDKTSGEPPIQVTFTTAGSSTTDSIAKITLTYGDGAVDTVATGSGIGTGNVNTQTTHIYSGAGTFTASAVLQTTGGATSQATQCQQILTIGGAPTPTPLAAIPPTGPGDTILLIGGIAGLATAVGAFLLFAL